MGHDDQQATSLLGQMAAAVAAAPDAVELRVHYARLLIESGDHGGAAAQLREVLARQPGSREAREMHDRLEASRFDWEAAEAQVGDLAPTKFVETGPDRTDGPAAGLRLADVAGMADTKARIEAAFLAPLRNPTLRRFLGKRLRGGLLLYGPPGCGKTYMARAVAGEMGAGFLTLSIADVLAGQWVGDMATVIRESFAAARARQPSVLFLDEIDALGARRSAATGVFRNLVNLLLEHMDGVSGTGEELFLLAATNHPWDVDPAFTRPGRLDQLAFVPPPDRPARAAILRDALEERPVEGIDLDELAARSEGYSAADLVRVCEAAAEQVLIEITRTQRMRMIGRADLSAALKSTRPSIGAWLDTARNVVTFANGDGRYDDLAAYLASVPGRR
jgi:AAA+ superfamily predicted ATPase